jgi:hypothetical protein
MVDLVCCVLMVEKASALKAMLARARRLIFIIVIFRVCVCLCVFLKGSGVTLVENCDCQF